MTTRNRCFGTRNALAGLLAMAGAFAGCGSTNSRGSGGAGGHAGTSGSLGSSTLGSGGSSSGGVTGPVSGGAGSGGTSSGGLAGTAAGGFSAGGGGSGGIGSGDTGGKASGGAGSGGVGSGGSGGQTAGGGGSGHAGSGGATVDAGGADAGVCPAGEMWCPGCTPGSGSCGQTCAGAACPPPPDAGCVGPACSPDAASNQDVPPACSQLRTQAACDQRSDCHSVSTSQKSCACAAAGCCTTFERCDDGGSVACSGQVSCTSATPYCEAPYAVQYQSNCFNGCVLASKCAPSANCPLAPPSNGTSCGGVSLSCAYQDCAGAGRTQANCQGGTWSVQTVTCDSVACKGGGVYSGGDVICSPGQICVHTTGGGGAYIITPSCATNNCGSSPVTLTCVQGLSGSCFVVSDSEISCSTSTCTSSDTCPP